MNVKIVGNIGFEADQEKKIRMYKKKKTRNERIKN